MDFRDVVGCVAERLSGAGASRAHRSLAQDRRYAAVHEAGHYVVAAYFGVPDLSAWIYRSDASPDDIERKGWLGHFRYPRNAMARLSRRRRAAVALAGWAAERAWEGRHSEEPDEWWHSALWEHNVMSSADWCEAGCEPGQPTRPVFRAAELARGLLNPAGGVLWHPLLAATRILVRSGRASSDVADALPRLQRLMR